MRPILLRAADDGTWPDECSLEAYYDRPGTRGITYRGLHIRMEVRTPGAYSKAFALSIADLRYGQFD